MSDPLVPGVAFNAPPPELLPSIRASIDTAVADLDDTKKLALVGLVNEHGGNAAVVARFGRHWDVKAWVGKTWRVSDTQYGASVKASWP